jgi:ribA/ribD-fused uncharacterized protein
MAEQQSPEWKQLFLSMDYEQLRMYSEGKERIQKQNHQAQWLSMSQDEKDAYHRRMTSYYVRHIRYLNERYEERLPEILQKRLSLLNDKPEQFYFFGETSSPFSQWHPASFEAITWLWPRDAKRLDYLAGEFPADTQRYSSAEQFMMYHKAILFLDRDIAREIMATDDVRKIKALGREVKNYEQDVWEFYRADIVWEGNLAKFGLHRSDEKAQQRNTWQGLNLLGEILTGIREELVASKI